MRRIDPDEIRQRYEFKLFRHVPLFLLGVLASRLVGFLYFVPGLWIIPVIGWVVWVCIAGLMAFSIYMNVRQFKDWDESIDLNQMAILLIVGAAMLLGTGLELLRVGG